jgi:hypothetical protein
MASREQFLDDYEKSRLIFDSDDSEYDRHSDDDIAPSGSEDEEDAVDEDLDDNTDSMYDVTDTGDHGQLENTDYEHSEAGQSTDEETNVFKARALPGAGHLPQLHTLVQPFSGQDRGGRNVTTDNFFTSVDLVNQLKNRKLTLVGTMKQNKRGIPQESKPARQRDKNSSLFGFTKNLTLV